MPATPSDAAVEACTAEGFVDDTTVDDDDYDLCVAAYDDPAAGAGATPTAYAGPGRPASVVLA